MSSAPALGSADSRPTVHDSRSDPARRAEFTIHGLTPTSGVPCGRCGYRPSGSACFSLRWRSATSTGCSRPPGLFSEPNARAHIGMLAGTIGSRPIGTPANARARDYIIDQLRLFGFEVRVQETDARRAALGRDGARRQHHRGAAGPAVGGDRASSRTTTRCRRDLGAGDDALGVGVSLEAARVLAARADRNWTLMILVTDGEEAGLMGAAALVTDRDVMSRLHAYVNVESIGSAGDPMLFETGPGNGWLVDAVGAAGAATARRVVRARDLSAAAERHRLLHPQAAGHPGPELRHRRRQLRVSHHARHARAPVAAHGATHGRTSRRAS